MRLALQLRVLGGLPRQRAGWHPLRARSAIACTQPFIMNYE